MHSFALKNTLKRQVFDILITTYKIILQKEKKPICILSQYDGIESDVAVYNVFLVTKETEFQHNADFK